MVEYGKYGLPLQVQYCKSCTISNQRPSSSVEFSNKRGDNKTTVAFDENGICDACNFAALKNDIDWSERARELAEVCDRFRRSDGGYDVLIPGSGGKDSVMAAHILKYKFNMNPLLVTWPPALYTNIGRKNFDSWLLGGYANYTYHQNRKLHRLLTRLAFENLGHPFQPFMLGQKILPPRLANLLGIKWVVYGENEAEYGNPLADNTNPVRDVKFFSREGDIKDLVLAGVPAGEFISEYGFSLADLEAYLPMDRNVISESEMEVHYLGYYIKWSPQDAYYYCVENTDFLPNDERSEGSYSKYSSIDDKIDWIHYHTTLTKFGIGRATYDTAQEIRNGNLTRDEGISLVRQFDGEFPSKYINDCCEYMGISLERYQEVIDEIRSPHLWTRTNDGWRLKSPIWQPNNSSLAG